MKTISICALVAIGFVVQTATAAVPTALFHGLGDSCYYPGMKEFTNTIANLTDAKAHCVEIGWGSVTSIFENFEKQAEDACNSVLKNPDFQGEFNVLGLSQGGLIARHIAERCPIQGKVRNLITLGGPNMGVAATPHCFTGIFCDIINYIVDNLVYFEAIQDIVGPAGYFRDPRDLDTYLKDSVFLPYLNNEKSENYTTTINERFSGLNSAMFVKFTNDTMIYPKETAWFWQLQADGSIIPVQETDFYKNDLIGLRALEQAGKVQYVDFEGDHLHITDDEIENIIAPFLMQ